MFGISTNLGEDSFFGKDNKQYTYRIDALRSISQIQNLRHMEMCPFTKNDITGKWSLFDK